jgi:hypothetical protein
MAASNVIDVVWLIALCVIDQPYKMLLAFYAPQKRRRLLTAWAHFLRVTPEALGLIVDYLNPIETKSFQQVCKYFAEIASAKRAHVKKQTSEYLLLL